MRDGHPDPSLLIGLHKLAEQTGDGLVPELYALLAERRQPEGNMTNVVPFPRERSFAPSAAPRGTSKVLSFRR